MKTEFIDDVSLDEVQSQKVAEETPSPHLQDHQYGQTPCYQITRRPAQPPPRTEVAQIYLLLKICTILSTHKVENYNKIIELFCVFANIICLFFSFIYLFFKWNKINT